MSKFSLGQITAIAIALPCLVVVSMAASYWHLDLLDSFPKADQVLTESPDTLRFWFNQEPDLPLAAASIDGPTGRVKVGEAQPTDDPKSFKVDVLERLDPGSYKVVWRAAGSDGHAIRGRLNFEIRAAPANR